MATLGDLLNGRKTKSSKSSSNTISLGSVIASNAAKATNKAIRNNSGNSYERINYNEPKKIKTTNGYKNISGIETMLRQQGIYTDMMYDKYQRFKRFPIIDLSRDILRTTKEYIFITKPELNIYKDKKGTILNDQFKIIPMFADINKRYPMILRQLQLDLTLHESPFINLLSYTVQNTIDLPDTNSKEMYSAANIYGTKLAYRGNSYESDQDVSFTLEFRENNIAEVYTLLKLWDHYTNLKSQGIVSPPSKTYAEKRMSHDKVSAYKIITTCNDDILFWAKWWGVYPDGAPRSSWSEVGNDGLTHNVQFKADLVDDMDPQILEDFNEIVEPYKSKCPYGESKTWITKDDRQNNEVQIVPYIEKHGNSYKLKWLGGSV